MMLLGPNNLLSSAKLETIYLRGLPQYAGGTLFFSPDDRFLVNVTGGCQLSVWDLCDLRELALDGSYVIRQAIWDAHDDGLLVVANDCIVLLRFIRGGTQEDVLIRNLPRFDDEDGEVGLLCSDREFMVCTSRWIRQYDRKTRKSIRETTISPPIAAAPTRVRVVENDGSRFIRIISHQRRGNAPGRLYTTVSMEGINLSSLHVAVEGMKYVDSADASMVIIRGIGDSATVMTETRSNPMALTTIRSSDTDMFECTCNGMMFLSAAGRSYVGVTPHLIAVWNDGELVRTFTCEGVWCNAHLSNDGSRLVVVYLNG